MNHESLSVLEQKRTLREMSKLRAKRPEAAALESTIRTLENAAEERARLGAELKASRDALEPLREKRAMSLKIVDHYAGCADAAVDDSAEAYAAKTARVTEVKRLRKEGYEARKARRETAQSREREEWLLARRTYGEARDLVANGHFAEAEAACLRQMEHVHARLNADREYRAKYLEGLGRDRETREAAAKAAIEADAEATAKALAEAKAAALEAKREKERAEASREKEEKERARAEKEELRRRAKEERAAADAALAEDVRRRAELARRGLEADSEGGDPFVHSHRPRRSSAPPRSPPPSRGRWTNPRQRHLPRVQTAARPFPHKTRAPIPLKPRRRTPSAALKTPRRSDAAGNEPSRRGRLSARGSRRTSGAIRRRARSARRGSAGRAAAVGARGTGQGDGRGTARENDDVEGGTARRDARHDFEAPGEGSRGVVVRHRRRGRVAGVAGGGGGGGPESPLVARAGADVRVEWTRLYTHTREERRFSSFSPLRASV